MRVLSPGARVWDADSCRARVGELVAVTIVGDGDGLSVLAKVVWDDRTMQVLDARKLIAFGHEPRYLRITESRRSMPER
jgi:hypothetical protein